MREQSSVEYLFDLLFDPSWKEGIEIQKQWFKKAKQLHKKELDESYQEGYQNGHEAAMSYIENKEK